MRPPRLLLRRGLIDPLWIPLAVALACLLTVLAGLALLATPFGSRRRVCRLGLFGALYMLIDAWMVLRCAGLWLRYPVAARRGQHWADTHVRLLRAALALLVAASRPLLGFRVEAENLPAPATLAGRPILVLARHGGPGDSFAIAEVLLSDWLRRPVIVLKETLRWDPGLDLVLSRLGSCFLPVRRAGRDLPAQVAAVARDAGEADAILLFPEGGNWTPRRHRLALAKLSGRGRRAAAERAAANPHVLPPQPAGMLACLDARPDLAVMVLAHTGLDDLVSAPEIWRALPVGDRPMIMRWWHLPADELPADAEMRRDWLDMQWAILDSWIDARKAAWQRQHQPAPDEAALPAAPPGTEAVDPEHDKGYEPTG
jgi:1-acyl-sn-glycerol-3-phosphate acyltransferase